MLCRFFLLPWGPLSRQVRNDFIALAIISVSQLVLSGCGCCNIMSGLYLALTCILCTHLRHSFRTIFVMAPMVEESVNAHHTSTHALFLVNSYAQKTSSQTGPRCNGTLVAKPQWRTRGTPLHNGKESWIRYKIFNTKTAQYQIRTSFQTASFHITKTASIQHSNAFVPITRITQFGNLRLRQVASWIRCISMRFTSFDI